VEIAIYTMLALIWFRLGSILRHLETAFPIEAEDDEEPESENPVPR
jgi:hypothetical protein